MWTALKQRALWFIGVVLVVGIVAVSLLPLVHVTAAPSENISARTLTGRSIINGDGTTTFQGSQGAIHYRDSQGNWTPIDNGITSNGSMLTDAYNFRVLQNRFNFGQIIQYSVNGCTVNLQPMNLEYVNDLNQIQPIATPQNVVGVYSNSTAPIFSNPNNHIGKVTYANAYGTGINMSWGLDAGRVTKLLTIQSAANLPTPTNTTMSGGHPSIRLSFIFDHSANISVYGDGTLWNEGTQAVSFSNIDFRLSGNRTVFYFLPITYYDSSNNSRMYQANATLRRSGQSLFIEAKVPLAWLQTAVFPVFIDPSSSAQVGASNQDSTVDKGGTGTAEPDPNGATAWGLQLATNPLTWGCQVYQLTDVSGVFDWSIDYRNGAGILLPSVGVPTGSTITESHFIITPQASNSGGTVNAKITGNKVGNAAVWSTLANYQARRGTAVDGATNDNRTAAQVTWSSISADTVDVARNSPDIKTVVQEIVDLGTWAENNNMAFWIDDHDHLSSDADGAYRTSWSYDGSTSKCPQISITYTGGGGGGGASLPDDTDIIMFISMPMWSKN